jgi:hypothetical protein
VAPAAELSMAKLDATILCCCKSDCWMYLWGSNYSEQLQSQKATFASSDLVPTKRLLTALIEELIIHEHVASVRHRFPNQTVLTAAARLAQHMEAGVGGDCQKRGNGHTNGSPKGLQQLQQDKLQICVGTLGVPVGLEWRTCKNNPAGQVLRNACNTNQARAARTFGAHTEKKGHTTTCCTPCRAHS